MHAEFCRGNVFPICTQSGKCRLDTIWQHQSVESFKNSEGVSKYIYVQLIPLCHYGANNNQFGSWWHDCMYFLTLIVLASPEIGPSLAFSALSKVNKLIACCIARCSIGLLWSQTRNMFVGSYSKDLWNRRGNTPSYRNTEGVCCFMNFLEYFTHGLRARNTPVIAHYTWHIFCIFMITYLLNHLLLYPLPN